MFVILGLVWGMALYICGIRVWDGDWWQALLIAGLACVTLELGQRRERERGLR